ncbi:hypothetical protein MPSEU_000798600 [Mayamaea pseudoterrestris]|nr:hypothetical protein MPSEU_000798600 [Mayamaea pseudoterrestris]
MASANPPGSPKRDLNDQVMSDTSYMSHEASREEESATEEGAFATPTSSSRHQRRPPSSTLHQEHYSSVTGTTTEISQPDDENFSQQTIKDGITRFFYPSRTNKLPDRRSRIAQSKQRNYATTRSLNSTDGLERVAESSGLSPTNAVSSANGSCVGSPSSSKSSLNDINQHQDEANDDADFVTHFWRMYDDVIILSIFTQIGILFRLAAATWFTYFDGVFSEGSALFVVLPMNCLSCFIMGLLCSGERLMEIVTTRFSPPRLQHDVFHEAEDQADGQQVELLEQQQDEAMVVAHDFERGSRAANLVNRLKRRRQKQRQIQRRRAKTEKYFHSWEPPVHLNQDLRDVQLLALERRMRASKCLVLFPVRKEDVDVMECYFRKGYSPKKGGVSDHDYDLDFNRSGDAQDLGFDLQLEEDGGIDSESDEAPSGPVTPQRPTQQYQYSQSSAAVKQGSLENGQTTTSVDESASPERTTASNRGILANRLPVRPTTKDVESPTTEQSSDLDLDQMLQDVQANITENVNRLSRVDLAAGWDKGTTPDEMSDDLMLGLRDGFCGALSSFSSWQSSMVSLMRMGRFGEAFTGYVLGVQLPLIAYRSGQTAAVYIFIWRCRWETRRDMRRGYGIRVNQEGSDSEASDHEQDRSDDKELVHALPSVRAIATAVFVVALAAQVTSLFFYNTPESQLLALSLLFSPLGVFSRWRLSRLNKWRSTFPLGTFSCNMIACALSGSLGRLLAGNPNSRQRIVLQSIVAGFGATLSSLAAFIVEVLAGVDPILFRFDGLFYAVMSVGCGMFASFIFGSTGEWADQTDSKGATFNYTNDDMANATTGSDGAARWLLSLY